MTVCAKALSNLPPLSKGGGLTARHKLLIYCVCLQYIRLFILQAFLPSRRRDCHATLACINPSKTALSLEKHYILARPRKRVRFCCSVKPSQLWWGLNLIELLSIKLQSIRSATIRSAPTIPKLHYPSLRTTFLPYERSVGFASHCLVSH